MKAMENKKEPLMSAEEYFKLKYPTYMMDEEEILDIKDYANYVTQWHLNNAKEFVAENEIKAIGCDRNGSFENVSIYKQSIHNAIDNYIEINLNK